jgi:hypothetical protein
MATDVAGVAVNLPPNDDFSTDWVLPSTEVDPDEYQREQMASAQSEQAYEEARRSL